jgi:hypothetical protein
MARNPKNVFVVVLVWTAACFTVAGLIGQDNDGPWGGLPEWLGAFTWFGFLAGVLALLVSAVWWAARATRRRATP